MVRSCVSFVCSVVWWFLCCVCCACDLCFVKISRRDLPQARGRFRILGVHRDGTVKTNFWTQPLDGEEYARVRLRLFVRGNGHVLASTKAHGWTRMPDERGRVSATYVHLRLRTRRSTPESIGSVSVTLLADAGVYPDWAKVVASDSAPSDGLTLGETAISETLRRSCGRRRL